MKLFRPRVRGPAPPGRLSRPVGPRAGFTLVEVILGIGIAIGILVVALYFYSQAVDLRSRLLEEADQLSSIRLILDRMTSDLRAAYAQPQAGFTGTASSLRFVVTGVPGSSPDHPSGWLIAPSPQTDLKLVSYSTTEAAEGTNTIVLGLNRTEQLYREPSRPTQSASNEFAFATTAGVESAEARKPLIEGIRFLQFWYWDGTGWDDHWDSPSLPACIEVNLGAQPLPEGTHPLDYPYELFRRVIYLPGSRAGGQPDELEDLLGEEVARAR